MPHAISAHGLALVQEFEGFRAEPARLPDGNWMVGHGHVRIGEPGEPVDVDDAARLLTLDLAPYENLVNACVTQSLSQAQFDALVSFAFSVGADSFEQSQVLRRVNAGDFVAAACAMDAWRKAEIGGETVVVDCLVRRRAAEKAMFLRDMPRESAPSVLMRAKLDYAASILGAPVKYAPVPELHIAPAPQPQAGPAQRLTEILKSEPATEALLLTQVVADTDEEEEVEIVTAHAKPVARPLDHVREATRLAYAASLAKQSESRLRFFARKVEPELTGFELPVDRRLRLLRTQGESRFALPGWVYSIDHPVLIALLVFGLGLIMLGGSLLFDGAGALASVLGAVALVVPGLTVMLLAAVGLRRGQAKAA
jgi:lysozyme